ncbi:hypothetical protein U5640_43045 [Streptomyces sp. SS7]|uniref:DUF6953 family protein n=1 Tax=Streptomyces sp. SS7 TaxID=3108485 RepID=UPI0030ED6BFC
MFVYERPPAPGAAAVVVAHGRKIGEAEAPTRVRGHTPRLDRYLDAALRECLADEGTQPGSLRLGQERELPVARQVHPITTLSAPKYPHQVPNRSKMRIIAATGPGAFFRCSRTNDNGNPAIHKTVLKAFKEISGDTVVWNNGWKGWSLRSPHDPAGRRRAD